ncbi:MAG: hypothetical protein OEW70_08340, partial [candidate division WOR-3 bacterium]|nr:hypothetical protein [candidate division WOR-3 bacterium]
SSVTVQIKDVGVAHIVSSPATIDSGNSFTPACTVSNYGTTTESYQVRTRIGSFYDSIATVNGHAAGTKIYLQFPNWTAIQRGIHSLSCSTELNGDMNKLNDKQTGSVFVRVLDVATTNLLSPSVVVDSGTVVTPACSVFNFGNTQVNYQVRMKIGSFYDSIATVNNHNPGTRVYVQFPVWIAFQRGTHAISCSTELSGDMVTTNDKLNRTVTLRVLDVATISMVSPPRVVDSGTVITPACSVYNYGTTTESYNVRMKIGNFYNEDTLVSNHTPDTYQYVQFPTWTANQRGMSVVSCSTELAGDMNPGNDKMIDTVTVRILDVATTIILAPTGTIDSATIVTPACSVYNYGNQTVDFLVRMKIGNFYNDSVQISAHPPGTYACLEFMSWNAIQVGTHTVSCSTDLANDMNLNNDMQSGSVTVQAPIISSDWQTMAQIPTAPSGKRPKSGSCMAGLEATGLIYFLKASNKNDFYSYDPNTNTWTPLETIPKGDKATNDGKNPKKGSAMAPYEDAVYALRGNNTLGFWKYIAVADTGETLGWKKMADFPTGAKRVKDGSGLVTVTKGGNDYLFAARGAKQSDFYLYDMAEDSWIKVTSPPVGQSGKTGYKKGSCMAYDGEYVYVLQGYYGSFFRYKVEADSWFELRQYSYKIFLNRDGKKKKPKDGAALVYYNNNVYMLKGGNTNEVWMYSIAADSWSQMNENWDIPLGASNRKVKGGGGLIMFGDMSKDPTLGGFFVSKGANTDEFYRHELPSSAQLPSSAGACPQPVSGACYSARIESEFPSYQLKITPNPAINVTAVRYTLPRAGPVSFKLYDITGAIRLRQTITNPTKDGVFLIDAKALPSG